ncbi:MAG: hypothetical protein H6882_05125 [Rhodobiaceae bacterium]|nr:hypothetical protein [Rhodobiaceae bacterium]
MPVSSNKREPKIGDDILRRMLNTPPDPKAKKAENKSRFKPDARKPKYKDVSSA